jgi:hypothetical protein
MGGAGPTSNATLLTPQAVALDENQNVFVADFNNHRVLMYPKGSSVASFVYGQDDMESGAPNLFHSPTGVAFDLQNRLYVSERTNSRIRRFILGNKNVDLQFGGTGATAQNTLSFPRGVAIDVADNIFVSDSSNNRVLRFGVGSIVSSENSTFPPFSTSTVLIKKDETALFREDVTANYAFHLIIAGRFELEEGATVRVNGTIKILSTSQITLAPGSVLESEGSTIILPGAQLIVLVDSEEDISVVVASFNHLADGRGYSNVTVVGTFAGAECFDFTGTQSVGSASLSVAVSVAPSGDCTNGGGDSSPAAVEDDALSKNAVIGIAVGAALGGVLLILVVVLLMVFARNRKTVRMNRTLKDAEMAALSPSPGPLL